MAVGDWSWLQCSTIVTTRLELCKNTVQDTVVQQLNLPNVSQKKPEGEPEEPEWEEESCPLGSVPCDYCSKVAGAKTCLTCIASFCQEHLRPHLESQAFSHHQLQNPLTPSELGLRVSAATTAS